MKKARLIFALTALIAGTMLTKCQSSSGKVEDAQERVNEARGKFAEANQALDQAIKDSIRQFKKESEERINIQEKNIVDLRAKIAKENNEDKVIYEQRLAVMEQQNRDMKKSLAEFNEARKDDWEKFRAKFNHDMEEHGKAFRDFWRKRK